MTDIDHDFDAIACEALQAAGNVRTRDAFGDRFFRELFAERAQGGDCRRGIAQLRRCSESWQRQVE